MKKILLSIVATLSFLTGALFFTSNGYAQTTVKVASDIAYAPFEYQDSNQQWAGIDVELMKQAAKMNGWQLEMTFPGFDAAINNLQAGKVDAVIAGMTITDARKQIFDFSDPYYNSAIVIATTKQKKIASYDALKGKIVGVKNGTAGQTWLEANQSKYGFTIKTYKDGVAMTSSLKAGNVDAIMDEYPVLSYAITQGANLSINIKPIPLGSYGFAVMKGTHPELIAGFNKALATMKANGDYQKIVDKYTKAKSSNSNSENSFIGILKNNWKQFASGLLVTLELLLLSFILAMVIGTFFGLAIVSPNRVLRTIARIYIDFIRDVPLLVFTIFLFYGIPNLLQLITGQQSPINEFLAGTIALTLNASAYIAEIIRGGVNAVPKGQMEASLSLGVSYGQTMRKVILPQALKVSTPSLVNQFIISLKDTTLVSVIGLTELLQTGQIIVARTYQSFIVYGIVALIYIIVIQTLTILARKLERSLK
ncbi:MAG: amino acid ABC transporter substrate-binding protein/permease [Streptococcaceae bacterium]|jgi:polar amino acid transport system substrate-binding protein|nr:amino acid ABC transporter substrate-binding protein/permease [Streptococcaceae bacterium]